MIDCVVLHDVPGDPPGSKRTHLVMPYEGAPKPLMAVEMAQSEGLMPRRVLVPFAYSHTDDGGVPHYRPQPARREPSRPSHTAAPWSRFGDEIYGADGTRVAEAVTRRDAPLLVEAPELLQCLRAIEVLFAPSCRDSTQAEWLDKVQALLKRIDAA